MHKGLHRTLWNHCLGYDVIYKNLLFSLILIGECYKATTIFYTLYYSLSEELTFALFSSILDLGLIAGSIQRDTEEASF